MRIKELRKERGLTQEELAKICGFDANRLSSAERAGSAPRPETLRRIARGLNVTVDELFDDHPALEAC